MRALQPSRKAPDRKAAFKAALAYAGMTEKAWREQRQPPVTREHVYQVLTGKRESATLTRDVDAFIAEHTPRTVAA